MQPVFVSSLVLLGFSWARQRISQGGLFDLVSEFVKDHWRAISNNAVIRLVVVVVNELVTSTLHLGTCLQRFRVKLFELDGSEEFLKRFNGLERNQL